MALILNDSSKYSTVAESDIVCYKLMCINEKKELRTYFTNTPVDLKVGQEIKRFNPKLYKIGALYLIEEGALHSFVEPPVLTAKMLEDYLIGIYQCIIPKGSEYFKGTDSNGELSYASEKLVYKKMLFQITDKQKEDDITE